MNYNQDITLDLNTNTSYLVVGAKQGDNESRTLTITILENGKPFYIPEDAAASYRISKPNGTGAWNNAEIIPSENKVIITFSATDLSVAGRNFADVLITSGTTRLSTTSFILDVQAAPNITNDIIESDSFNYIYSIIDNANQIIEDARVWVDGTRGSEEVLGDSYTISVTGNINVSLNFDTFKEKITPSSINKITEYIFTYTSNGWEYNGSIQNMSTLGFTITGTPSSGNIIKVTASFADPAWHNNAKWYMEALKNASIGTVTTADPGKPGSVNATYNDNNNKYNFNFAVPSVKPHATANVQALNPDSTPTATVQVTDAPSQAASGELGSLQKSFDFTFGIPRGVAAGFADDMSVEVNTLAPGSNATAQVQVVDSPDNAKQFKFIFGLPVGATGATGATGAAGQNGTNGTNGQDGQDGATINNVFISELSDNRISFTMQLSDGRNLITPSIQLPSGRDGVISNGTTFAIGTVTQGINPSVSIRTVDTTAYFDFVLPSTQYTNTNGNLVITI